MSMDIVASFKAALLQARQAELELRATCLTELEDMKAMKDFNKQLVTTLDRLRTEDKIPDEPLDEFLPQVSRVMLWQFKLVEQEKYFADRIKRADKQIDELIGQGLPAEHWAALKSEIEGLEAEFNASKENWSGSLPDELWQIATSDEVREQLDDLIHNADNANKLTVEVGWEDWEVDPSKQAESKSDDEREIPVVCSYCEEKLKFSFGLAGKEVECPECFADITLPAPNKVMAEERAKAEARLKADSKAPVRNPGLPDGWKDHFDPRDDAKARLAARPAYDAESLNDLVGRIAQTEERCENWQKYFPRMTATGLPFDHKKAWDLLADDPRALIGRMADEWPQEDWMLSPRIGVLFADGKAGLSDAVALLATEKPDLEKQTRDEIRDRVRQMAPIISAADYKWQCDDAGKIKMTYTKLLDKKCPGHNWMRSFEVKDEVTAPFGSGLSVGEGLATLLTGKSKKQALEGSDLEDVFTRMRRLPEIAEDLYCDDGSQLTDARELPGDWRFRFWDEAQFETREWIVSNPLAAMRLLCSDLPQIVADYTGRQRLLQWREKAAGLLDDEELSAPRKAMLLPVVLGIADEPLFISEFVGTEESTHQIGEKLTTLREEVDRSFRSSEVRGMLDSGFADKLAIYCDQHWLIEKLQSEATTRRKGMSYGLKAVAAVVVAGVLWFAYTMVMETINKSRNDALLAETEALAAMKVTYELDYSLVPTNFPREAFVPQINGKPVESGERLDKGAYTVTVDHPHFETFSQNIVLEPGSGADLGTIKFTRAKGNISITTDPPGATVKLGETAAGKTPLKLPEIVTGEKSLTLTLEGFGTWQTNFVLTKSDPVNVNYRFGRGSVSFSSQPAGFMVATGPAGAGLDDLDWKGQSTPRTPIEIDALPGSYLAALIHPSMGGFMAPEYSVADQQKVPVNQDFPVAPVNVNGLAGTKLWRGWLTLKEWMNWQSDWKLSADQDFALLRLAKPGVQPRPVLLQKKGGSFSAVAREPFVPAGTLESWGSNARRQSTIPDAYQNAKFIDIAAGQNHTVGLLENGDVVAWGDNSFGQSRVGDNVGKCIMVAAGDNHTVVLKADGTVLAWGANHASQAKVPEDLGPCVAISAAGQRSAAIRADGGISGWGGFGVYQLASKTPWRPFADLSVGTGYIVALDDRAVASVLIQTQTQVGTPKQAGALAAAAGACIDFTGGGTVAHLLKPDGKLVNITTDPRAPKPPANIGPLARVSGGYDRFSAIDADGGIIIWGRKTGITTKYGFERKTDDGNRVQYWYRAGKYLKVVCGESHYVAIKR